MNDLGYMLLGWAIGIPLGLIVSVMLIYLFDHWGD